MKRSYDYSFVQDSDNTTTAPHSFRRRPATLAAQPIYNREDYLLAAAGYYYQDSQAAPYLLHTYQGLDSDFQSNIWHQTYLASPANWRNELRLPVPERRLAGLGITFEPPEVLPNTGQRAQTDVSCGGQPLPMQLDTPHGSAYSTCPSAEFTTHLSSLQSLDYVPYSPTEEFLMLEDTPPTEDHKMEVDSPANLDCRLPGIHALTAALDSPDACHVGIIPDVNFRTLAFQRRSPVACVNPADITGPGPGPSFVEPKNEEDEGVVAALERATLQYPDSSPMDVEGKADFPAEAVSAIVSVLAASTQEQTVDHSEKRLSPNLPALRPRQYVAHPLTSVQLPAFASRSVGGPMVPAITFPSTATPVHRSPLAPVQPSMHLTQLMHGTNQLSPVLNAHEGVPLEDLRRRAEAFRTLNPGYDLDKTFLQAFAGRLSERGELTPDFRCYVKGCSQANKRRDHILVHVGSHVEHRPFRCDEW